MRGAAWGYLREKDVTVQVNGLDGLFTRDGIRSSHSVCRSPRSMLERSLPKELCAFARSYYIRRIKSSIVPKIVRDNATHPASSLLTAGRLLQEAVRPTSMSARFPAFPSGLHIYPVQSHHACGVEPDVATTWRCHCIFAPDLRDLVLPLFVPVYRGVPPVANCVRTCCESLA